MPEGGMTQLPRDLWDYYNWLYSLCQDYQDWFDAYEVEHGRG